MKSFNKKYIFISYSHEDEVVVRGIIKNLKKNGFRVWFDDHIGSGKEYDDVIANHVKHCEVFISIISKHYFSSYYCKKEMKYAISKQKKQFSIFLENISFEDYPGIEMSLNTTQNIMKYKLRSEEEFYQKLYSSPVIQNCKGEDCESSECFDTVIRKSNNNQMNSKKFATNYFIIMFLCTIMNVGCSLLNFIDGLFGFLAMIIAVAGLIVSFGKPIRKRTEWRFVNLLLVYFNLLNFSVLLENNLFVYAIWWNALAILAIAYLDMIYDLTLDAKGIFEIIFKWLVALGPIIYIAIVNSINPLPFAIIINFTWSLIRKRNKWVQICAGVFGILALVAGACDYETRMMFALWVSFIILLLGSMFKDLIAEKNRKINLWLLCNWVIGYLIKHIDFI